ncbi:HAD family hydrolase [Caballeronia glebae]|uniref:HAD family hydrolase n=1 Tax=Caballeronia glebae TaxID=1777143 RepID=A0A158BJI8_9BURK|nr:HAD family hydrolase [Caballeronia glebae]SAK70211.1 HAD family hydrolase [Caballeronia glebae]
MSKSAIFDVDGTLIDSVDLHALAWHEAFVQFGHNVTFEQARSQVGKGGDNLLPEFLTPRQIDECGPALEEWRGKHFKSVYLPLVRPFSAVPALLQRMRANGIKLAVASSAKKDELDAYLQIAEVADIFDAIVSSEDVQSSKPAPDVFEMAIHKLGVSPSDAIAIGDSPYDAQAATCAGLRALGLLSGGFAEEALREAGCTAIYTGPGGLLACLDTSVFGL